jgi:hypothetical protein
LPGQQEAPIENYQGEDALDTWSHLPCPIAQRWRHVTCTPRRNSESNPGCLSSLPSSSEFRRPQQVQTAPHIPKLARRISLGLRPRWRRRWPSPWWRRCSPWRRTPRGRCGWRCRSRGPSACRRRSNPTWWCSPTTPSCSSPTPTHIPPSA